jgi:hypothetical protein
MVCNGHKSRRLLKEIAALRERADAAVAVRRQLQAQTTEIRVIVERSKDPRLR